MSALSGSAQEYPESNMQLQSSHASDNSALMNSHLSFQPNQDGESPGMQVVYSKHQEVQSQIDSLHENTRDMLWRQQQDLIRSFRAQIQDMHQALTQERDRNDRGSASWVRKCENYKKELDWLRSLTDKLTTENKIFIRENRRFQQQLNTIEQDKSFLMTQLVIAKKENARLRLMLEKAAVEVPPTAITNEESERKYIESKTGAAKQSDSSKHHPLSVTPITAAIQRSATARTASATKRSSLSSSDTGPYSARTSRSSLSGTQSSPEDPALRQQYEAAVNTISQLRKDLKRMENRCRNAETKTAEELSNKSQLLDLLKIGVEEYRKEILARKEEHARLLAKRAGIPAARLSSTLTAASLSSSGGRLGSSSLAMTSPVLKQDPRDVGLDKFSLADRARLVEWLISQDIVIYALYELLFPVSDRGSGLGLSAVANKSLGLSGSSTSRIQRAVNNAVTIAQAHAQNPMANVKLLSNTQPLQSQRQQLQGNHDHRNQEAAEEDDVSSSYAQSSHSSSSQYQHSTGSSVQNRRLRPASSTRTRLVPNQAEINELSAVPAWGSD